MLMLLAFFVAFCGFFLLSFSNMVISTLDLTLKGLCPLETSVCYVFNFPKFCLVAPHAQQDAYARGVEMYQMCCFKFPVTIVGDPMAEAPSSFLP